MEFQPLKGRTFKGGYTFHKVLGFPADLPMKLCQKPPTKTQWLDMTNRVKVVVVPLSGERWITFHPLTISSWDGDIPTPNLQAYQYQQKHKLAKAIMEHVHGIFSFGGPPFSASSPSLSEVSGYHMISSDRQASTFNCWREEDSFKRKSSVPKAHTKSMAFEKICVCLKISTP